jgi:acyl-coenzyme A synthetase/AMP-(fatty) acid ligase/quercetin dioxygenase-like cupin family protein
VAQGRSPALPEWHDADACIAAASPQPPRRATKASDVMLCYFTSGTAGMPKMVTHNFAYPLGHILTARYWQGCEDGGLHFTIAETGWAKASWGKIYGQWISGSAVMVYDFEKFHAAEIAEVVRRFRVTTFCAPPTMYRYMIKERLVADDWASVRRACTAGEPLNPEVFLRFKDITGLEIREGFGQTESVVLVASWPWLAPQPGSMGKPSPGHEIDVVDDDGHPCESGEEGELVIRTDKSIPPGLFLEYAGDPERTASAWHNGMYHTGDVVWRDADGFHWFKGRKDDVIKSSGYRISPFEVENAIMEHPAVLEVAVTGAPDAERGVIVKATVVLAAGFVASDTLRHEIQDHVKRVTAPYKYPRVLEFVEMLPKTVSGKVRRVEIRSQDSERASRLRGLRLSLGHTTAEVAAATGIDEALYLEYEAAQRDLPISHLSLLSAFFHVESKVILAGEEAHARDLFVTRSGRGPVESRFHEHSFEALGTGFAHKRMQPFMVVVEPDDKPLALLKHPGQEFDYLVEGRLHFQIGGRVVILQAGDNIYFDATQPHGFKALDGKAAKFLAIITAVEKNET